ncbi:DUF2867 domain-containing protein [Serratia ureilytica]
MAARRAELALGDEIDGWKVITLKPLRQLALLFGARAPGLGRLSFPLPITAIAALDVRAWWHPAGFSGLLYWFAMMPAHLFIFRGMAKRIAGTCRVWTANSAERRSFVDQPHSLPLCFGAFRLHSARNPGRMASYLLGAPQAPPVFRFLGENRVRYEGIGHRCHQWVRP